MLCDSGETRCFPRKVGDLVSLIQLSPSLGAVLACIQNFKNTERENYFRFFEDIEQLCDVINALNQKSLNSENKKQAYIAIVEALINSKQMRTNGKQTPMLIEEIAALLKHINAENISMILLRCVDSLKQLSPVRKIKLITDSLHSMIGLTDQALRIDHFLLFLKPENSESFFRGMTHSDNESEQMVSLLTEMLNLMDRNLSDSQLTMILSELKGIMTFLLNKRVILPIFNRLDLAEFDHMLSGCDVFECVDDPSQFVKQLEKLNTRKRSIFTGRP